MLSFVFIYCALYLMIPYYMSSSWLLQTPLDYDSFWVFLVLMKLEVLKHIGQVFCRMPLNWNLSDIYLIIIVGLYVFMWMTTEIKYHSHHITSRVYIFNMTYHCCCEFWSRGLRWYLTDYCTIFFSFIFISWRLITLQYWSGFCYTLTWVSHGFTCAPHPNPPFLPIPSLWVFPVHQLWALVSCIQPGLVICFTLDSILVSVLFSQNITPLPSSTESKSLFCTSMSLFLFCI